MAFKVADGFVDVEFRTADAEARLKEALTGRDLKVKVDADLTELEARLAALRGGKTAGGKSSGAVVPVRADTAPIDKQLAELAARKVKIDADISRAEAKLEELSASEAQKFGALAARKLKVDADIQQAEIKLKGLRAAAELATGDRKVKVDADVASAEARLAELKVRLASIGDAQVKVDAEITAASANLAALRVQAAELDATRVTITADADTGAADAELAVTNAEVSRLDGRRANVTVDADVAGALAKIALVGAAIGGLGPIIVGGIGAAAGIGAIAGASIGAVGASLAGVGGAVKALGQSTSAAGGGASKAASSHLQMAAAIDRVKQAQASLANTQLSAADQERRAAESVAAAREEAARSVASAQRAEVASEGELDRANRTLTASEQRLSDTQLAAVRAQDALTDARKAAARELEDFQTRTEDMALAQRSADDAVRQAKLDLDKTLADPRNSDLQREQADLAYRQAMQQQKDLGKEAQRLADDKAEADKKGIDGSQQVVSATDQLIAAQKAVAEATQGVVAAQDAVYAAQQKVADSQAASAQAQIDGQRRVTDAVLAQVSAQRQADFSVAQAKQAVVDAQRAVQQASQQAGSAGAAATNKLRDAMKGLSPEGQKFARFLRGFIDGPLADLRKTGQNNLLPGLQRGLEALEPLMNTRITPAFGRFSKVLGDDIGAGIPIIGRLGASLLDFAAAGLHGLSPLNGVLNQFEHQLSGVLEKLVSTGDAQKAMGALVEVVGALLSVLPPLIEDGTKLFVALGPGLTATAKSLSGSIGALADEFLVMAPTLNSILIAIAPVTPALAALGAVFYGLNRIGAISPLFDLAKAAIGRFRGEAEAATTASGSSGLGGALAKLGLAFVALSAADAAFGQSGSVTVNTATKELQEWVRTGQSASDLTGNLDHDLGTLRGGFLGLGTAQRGVAEGLAAVHLGFLMGSDSIKVTDEHLQSLDASMAQLVQGGHVADAQAAFSKLTAEADRQGVSVDELKSALPQYQDALDGVKKKSDTATSATDRMRNAITKVTSQFLTGRSAEADYYAAVDRATQSLKDNGRTLDVHTEKGRANRQSLDEEAAASLRYVQSLVDQGAPEAKVQAALEESRKRLTASAGQFALTGAQAAAYATKILGIPTQASTTVRILGATTANAALQGILDRVALVNGQPAVVHLQVGSGNDREDRGVAKRASGGPVTKGVPYLVGEQRPELFVPRESGTIVPDISRAGGGTPITTGSGGNITIQSLTINLPTTATRLDLLSPTDQIRAARGIRDALVKLEGATR